MEEKGMEKKSSSKLRIAIIHPDLGIGGAERLVVDAAVELVSHGHSVHVFTSHHDKNRCFEETVAGENNCILGYPLTRERIDPGTRTITSSNWWRVNFTHSEVEPIMGFCNINFDDERSLRRNHLQFESVRNDRYEPQVSCFFTFFGTFPVTVYGSFLPRHIFYRLHAVCAYLRCIFVALCVLFLWPSFDVVVVDQVSVVIPLLKLKKSMKVVFYCHFPDMLLAQHTTFIRRFYRKPIDVIEEITTGMSDLVLVNSKFTASTFANTFKHLDARGIKPAVLYPAVNVDQFDEPHAYRMNFLSINRFERKKNIDLAVSAFALLRKVSVTGATLTIAGGYDKRLRESVDYLEELKVLAKNEGVSDQVKFITSCTTAERNSLLSECLCVIYTPKDEHFGIVPLEAMAAHKPVIACNSGGPIETIKNDVTGFLCDPTPQDFSSAMTKLIQEPQLAKEMGDEARKHANNTFSTKIFGKRLNGYLVDIVSCKRA